jgi:hypothetical protein
MALGLNRENDTPIGGLPEFRGNLQGGGVFSVNEVPVFDGEKFAPGSQTALLHGYGGLATNGSVAEVADGTLIDGWDTATPLGGTPLQMTPDPVTGVVTVDQDGVYQVDFSCNVSALANNQDYFFQLISTSGASGFGSHIVGSNNVSSQSTSFSLTMSGTATGQVGVSAHSTGDLTYTIVSMSLTVTRIG